MGESVNLRRYGAGQREIIIVEGEMDKLALEQAAGPPPVQVERTQLTHPPIHQRSEMKGSGGFQPSKNAET